MKKTNLLKGIICGLMLTAIAGSAVYAGTDTYEAYIKNYNFTKITDGDAGNYYTKAQSNSFTLTAKSTSTSPKLFYVEVDYKHYNTHSVSHFDAEQAILSKDGTVLAAIIRDPSDPFHYCESNAKAYNSSSNVTGIQDNYTCKLHQRSAE